MNMKKLLLLSVLALPFAAAAQSGITPDVMQQLRSSVQDNATDKAIRNALNSADIDDLAAVRADPVYDDHFTYQVKTRSLTNQKKSGRCWMFTGLNMLRAQVIAANNLPDTFTFSQTYLYFYDMLEKSNMFLQGIIDTADLPFSDRKVSWIFGNFQDGGQFTGVVDLITKYGLVPQEIMPETNASSNSAEMRGRIHSKLREYGLELRRTYNAATEGLSGKKAENAKKKALASMQARKAEMLKDVWRILSLCLGTPPEEFNWSQYTPKGKLVSSATFTPKSFFERYVGKDMLSGYILVMNNPTLEFGKVYEVDMSRHVYEGENWIYVNLPMDRIKEIAIASLRDKVPLYYSCDVRKFNLKGYSDPGNFDYESLFGVSFGMDKAARIATKESLSTHAMNLIGVDIKDGKSVKWLVENSWGIKSGHKGNLVLSDEWFDEYTFRLAAKKEYVPADILAMLDQKPIMCPRWDPMFIEDEGEPEGIGDALLKSLRASFKGTPADKAVRNALNDKGISELAKTNDLPWYDTCFTYRVKTYGVTNQRHSGRCWAFTGMNMLRAEVAAEKHLGAFTFSQNYVFFHDMLEKANNKLENLIECCDMPMDSRRVEWAFGGIGDGGSFFQFACLAMKYGLVPTEVMPETYSSNNSARMRKLINTKLKEDGLEFRRTYEQAVKGLSGKKAEAAAEKAKAKMQQMRVEMLKDIYRILSLCLGTPPEEFTWKTFDPKGKVTGEKQYTPQSFFQEFVGKDLLNEYAWLQANPAREYNKVYQTLGSAAVRGNADPRTLNIPVQKLKEIAVESLKGGSPIALSCDVNKFKVKGFSDPSAYDYESLLGVSFPMDKADRIKTGDSRSTHLMNLVAVQLKDGKPVRWMVENSWGEKGFNGNVILSDAWFDEYNFGLVLMKKYVPADVLSLYNQEPVTRYPWEPNDYKE